LSGVAIRCGNCGAPLRMSPETIVAICSYCGSPNWVRETARRELPVARSRPCEELLRRSGKCKLLKVGAKPVVGGGC